MNFKSLFCLFSLVFAGAHIPSPLMMKSLNEDIASGDIQLLKKLITSNSDFIWSPNTKQFRDESFRLAVKKGQTPVVELLLKEAHVNAASHDNEAIRIASANGNLDLVKMLLSYPIVNPSAKDNEALMMAAKNGHTEVVRLLIAQPEVNPAAGQNQALIWASQKNHPDIVRLLINDGRVDPGALHQHALRRAAYYGNVDLVRFILSHPSVDPNSYPVELIVLNSAYFGDLQSIKTLVEGGLKINQGTIEKSLQQARIRGHIDIVDYLEALNAKPNQLH